MTLSPSKRRTRTPFNFYRRYSINTKIIVVLTILLGASWISLDFIQGRQLKRLFTEQLNVMLQHHAQEARILFDKYTRSFHSSNKIIVSQKRFADYLKVKTPRWKEREPGEVIFHQQIPPWLPKPSVLRTLAHSQYYLLFDSANNLREVYTDQEKDLPTSLRNSAPTLRRLSHNQATMTEVDGRPFMIASTNFYDTEHKALGTLTLLSPINNDFLYSAIEGLLPAKAVALINDKTHLVIASNRPDMIGEGSSMEEIKKIFLLTGKSFFDYGVSDLKIHFVSLVPKNEYDALTSAAHEIGKKQRAIITLIMTLPLMALLFRITSRLKRLTKTIDLFSKKYLSGKQNVSQTHDQLLLLEERFTDLTHEIIQTNVESQNKYRALIETTDTGFVIVDEEGMVLDANQKYLRITGRANFGEIIDHNVQEWTAEDNKVRHFVATQKCLKSGNVSDLEIDYETPSGSVTPVEINAQMIEQEGQQIILCLIRDITERKEARQKLKRSLAEKEVLLREIHHRVKNNMQIISSMLYLQSMKALEPETIEVIKDSRKRVQSMSLIHEKLYRSNDLACINFGDYIKSLTDEIAKSYTSQLCPVQFNIEADNISLPVDSAIPCGLILNELTTNSFKYAFKELARGEINISFRREARQKLILRFKDNGTGLPDNFSVASSSSLGMSLVQNLTNQLHGTVEYKNKNGLQWTISFPAEHSQS